jgi:hypothetical protein
MILGPMNMKRQLVFMRVSTVLLLLGSLCFVAKANENPPPGQAQASSAAVSSFGPNPADTSMNVQGGAAAGSTTQTVLCATEDGGQSRYTIEEPYQLTSADYLLSTGASAPFTLTQTQRGGINSDCTAVTGGYAVADYYQYSFNFDLDTGLLANGNYSMTLRFYDDSYEVAQTVVHFSVKHPPLAAALSVAPINFNFDASGLTSGSGVIINTGTAGSSVNVACVASTPWLVIASCPSGPYVAGQPSADQPFTVHVNTSDPSVRAAGTYPAHITVSATPNSGTASIDGAPQTVGVTYTTSCTLNYGQNCSSAPNSCGMTNTGTYTCSGTCSAGIPSDSLCKAPPSCTFTGSPLVIVPPQQATLSWNCSNVVTCTINGTPVTPASSGSIKVSPTTNTTYTLSCNGAGGNTSKSVTVVVQGSGLQETNP